MSEVKVQSKDIMPIFIELLNEGKSVEFKISGHSMLPFFKHQQTVVTLSKKYEYEKYDVVLYISHDLYALHRIVGLKDDVCIVYGDALKRKEMIPKKDILGFVKYHTHKQKKIYYKNRGYLFKVKLWLLLKPLRRILLKIMRKVKMI